MSILKLIRNNKGITLISLVVTIIIMLILAGVSLKFVIKKDDGLLEKAKEVNQKYNEASQMMEEDRMILYNDIDLNVELN